MKYDVEVDPGNANTSHAIVLDLVGSGKRVLDVGCSTGYLARLLGERENVVCGVEIDSEAAAEAERWLDKLVIGDLEKLDLVESFGPGEFDVVVFADVLEHLTDPSRTLRQAVGLLRPGGFVVASIPNVAHGAVRLALLEGRFEYHPLGLLDDTHLRFYTRQGVEALLRSAGLVATEWRRTTADLFETEITLDPSRFPEDVVADIRRDADSTTYQFVVRAVPGSDDEATCALAGELVAKDQQLQELRQQMEAIARQAAGGQQVPTMGIVSATAEGLDGTIQALREAVVTAELRRRARGIGLRRYLADAVEASASWEGEPVHPLQPWSTERASSLAASLDAVVAVGVPPDEVLAGAESESIPVFFAGVREADLPGEFVLARPSMVVGPPPRAGEQVGGAQRVPDPLLLAGRLLTPEALARRIDYLRLLGAVPEGDGYVLAALAGVDSAVSPALARTLDQLASRFSLPLIVLQVAGGSPPAELVENEHTGFNRPDPLDQLAVVAGARLVVTDSAAIVALSVGLGRPCQALATSPRPELRNLAAWLDDPDLVAERPSGLLTTVELAEARCRDERTRSRLMNVLDLAFDELAVELRGSIGRRAASTVPQRLAELTERLAVLERANAALQARIAEERLALGRVAEELQNPEGPLAPSSALTPESEVRRIRQELEAARQEVAAIYATKTMRVLGPARRIYGRLRRR